MRLSVVQRGNMLEPIRPCFLEREAPRGDNEIKRREGAQVLARPPDDLNLVQVLRTINARLSVKRRRDIVLERKETEIALHYFDADGRGLELLRRHRRERHGRTVGGLDRGLQQWRAEWASTRAAP